MFDLIVSHYWGMSNVSLVTLYKDRILLFQHIGYIEKQTVRALGKSGTEDLIDLGDNRSQTMPRCLFS